jgi:hypothetical protein
LNFDHRKVVLAYGYRLGFAWNDPAMEAVVQSVLLPNWVESPGSQADAWLGISEQQIFDDGELWTTARDPVNLRHRLQQLVQIRLTSGAPDDTLFVHAGVVAFPPGLVVVPGPSKAGKSTLVRELVKAGGLFYSDEFAVIDSRGLVHPYPRDLWMRLSQTRREPTPASQLGWTPELAPAPIHLLLACHFEPWARWNPTPIPVDEAITIMAPHTKPRPKTEILRRALSRATCLKGARGPAPQIVQAIAGAWGNPLRRPPHVQENLGHQPADGTQRASGRPLHHEDQNPLFPR